MTPPLTPRMALVLAGALALTAVGCGSNPDDLVPADAVVAVPTDTADPNCGEVPANLAGKWTKTTHPEDLPPELFDADTGVVVMTLGPGHYLRADIDDDHRGQDQEACWTADRVVFLKDWGDCDLGIYEWTLVQDELDFTEVSDECFWRPWGTTIDIWRRVEERGS